MDHDYCPSCGSPDVRSIDHMADSSFKHGLNIMECGKCFYRWEEARRARWQKFCLICKQYLTEPHAHGGSFIGQGMLTYHEAE